MKKEAEFQSNLIKEIKERFPGSYVFVTDPNYIQGIPDLLILYKDKWAFLECKRRTNSKKQANQEYYISDFDNMSFASFIHPENKEEVLDELQHAFTFNR